MRSTQEDDDSPKCIHLPRRHLKESTITLHKMFRKRIDHKNEAQISPSLPSSSNEFDGLTERNRHHELTAAKINESTST